MTSQPATVFIVDDDRLSREALALLASSAGFAVRAFSSAEEFLDNYPQAEGPQCLILDIRLDGMSGLGLQEQLVVRQIGIPVIIVTGYSEVCLAVQAMRAGAVDFLEKPFNRRVLLDTIQHSLDRDAERRWKLAHSNGLRQRMELLSSREREVMGLLKAAKGTKEIASLLGICPKTVAKHRLRILEKLQVESVIELVKDEVA
jgi:FixJ family two-component response regulator